MEFVKARSFRISGVKDRGTYNASICDTAEAARSQSWNLLQQNRTLPLAHKQVKSCTQMSKYYDSKNIFSATVQMKYKYTMNYFDFMPLPCILFALSSFAAPTVAGFSRKRNDSTYLAGSARRRVVSEMKADAMFSRSGDHQELVFPVEGKNWFFDNTCDMWQLYRFLLKSANRQEIGG